MTARLLLGLFVSSLAFFNPTHAAVVVDQSFDAVAAGGPLDIPSVQTGQRIGQTFTIGVSGTLRSIESQLRQFSGPTAPSGDAVLTLHSVDAEGLPDAVIGTFAIPKSSVPLYDITNSDFVPVDVSSLSLSVVAGQRYAFDIDFLGTGNYSWHSSSVIADPGLYPGGDRIRFNFFGNNEWTIRNSSPDLGFRTRVLTVPEPSSFSSVCFVIVIGILGPRKVAGT